MYRIKKSVLLVVLLIVTCTQTMDLPRPRLSSAVIEWWWPKNTAHMSLVYFNKVKNYQHLHNAVETFKKQFEFEPLLNSTLDLLPNFKIINQGVPQDYMLHTSANNPQGDTENVRNIYLNFPPSANSPWHLVVKFNPNENRQFVSSLARFANNTFTLFNKSIVTIPHITLGKITEISDLEKFLDLIEKANTRDEGRFIDRIELPVFNDIELVKTNGKYLLMLTLPWEYSNGSRLRKKVKRLGKIDIQLSRKKLALPKSEPIVEPKIVCPRPSYEKQRCKTII